MPRIMKETVRPASTYLGIHELSCCLCGKKAPNPTGYDGDVWASSSYDIDAVVIKRKTGFSYPECGETETVEYDVCSTCWADVIVPMFEERNAKPEMTEMDW